MVKIGKLEDYFCIDLNSYEYNTINRYLEILELLKEESFIPEYSYIKIEKIIIIKEKCIILNIDNIFNSDISNIEKIVNVIDKYNININYLDNIPFFRSKEKKNYTSNKIYFINFLWATIKSKTIFKKDIEQNHIISLSKLSNKYLINNFLIKNFNMNIDIIKNINLYFFIYFNNYDNFVENLYDFINNKVNLVCKIRFIINIPNTYYDKIVKIIDEDFFNIFFLIKTENTESFNHCVFNVLSKLDINKLDVDILYIYDFDSKKYNNTTIKNRIYDIYKSKNEENKIIVLPDNIKINNIKHKDLNNFLIEKNDINNKLKKNFRCISNYNLNDIDYNNIYYKNTLLGKNGFLKLFNGGHNINYNFIGKIYPKELTFNDIIINKNCLNFLSKEIIDLDETLYNENDYKIIFSLILFYNDVKLINK